MPWSERYVLFRAKELPPPVTPPAKPRPPRSSPVPRERRIDPDERMPERQPPELPLPVPRVIRPPISPLPETPEQRERRIFQKYPELDPDQPSGNSDLDLLIIMLLSKRPTVRPRQRMSPPSPPNRVPITPPVPPHMPRTDPIPIDPFIRKPPVYRPELPETDWRRLMPRNMPWPPVKPMVSRLPRTLPVPSPVERSRLVLVDRSRPDPTNDTTMTIDARVVGGAPVTTPGGT